MSPRTRRLRPCASRLRARRADPRRGRRALVRRCPLQPGRMIDAARYQWDEGRRRLAEYGPETARYRHLMVLVDAVVDELRRRLGGTFTLGELAALYERAEDWVRET